PCVSTPFGAEGTGMKDGENILLARTPEEFAEKIKSLYADRDLWLRISDGGLEFLRREYDPSKVEAEMDELFGSVRKNCGSDYSWAKTPCIPKQEELDSSEK
ncbi:MAG: glycosyltransferase, partial [Lentisphaeria bacterium]|nr:glycosyltransferase [Lentisphaeria bacterium]